MNWTDGVTFLTPLIERAKTKVNQKRIFTCDTRQLIQETAIKNGCKTQVVQILRKIRDRHFIYKVTFLGRLPKSVKLIDEWIRKNNKYQEPEFYHQLFDESENWPFELPPGHIKTYDKKNQYLMLKSCMIYIKLIVLECSVHSNLYFTLLMIKVLLVILRINYTLTKIK